MSSYRNKYLDMLGPKKAKRAYPTNLQNLQNSILRVLRVRSMGAFQRFHPLSMPKGCPAAGAQNATRASSGGGLSSTRTTTPTVGCAGSAPLRPMTVAPATFAGCPIRC
jgi:hypothetical protein